MAEEKMVDEIKTNETKAKGRKKLSFKERKLFAINQMSNKVNARKAAERLLSR